MISGSTRYARHLGFFGGLGASEEVNPVEKIFGLNITPDPDGVASGLRLIARPSAIVGAILGGAIGGMVGPGKGKNYLTSSIVGAGFGLLVFGAVGAARSKGW